MGRPASLQGLVLLGRILAFARRGSDGARIASAESSLILDLHLVPCPQRSHPDPSLSGVSAEVI